MTVGGGVGIGFNFVPQADRQAKLPTILNHLSHPWKPSYLHSTFIYNYVIILNTNQNPNGHPLIGLAAFGVGSLSTLKALKPKAPESRVSSGRRLLFQHQCYRLTAARTWGLGKV